MRSTRSIRAINSRSAHTISSLRTHKVNKAGPQRVFNHHTPIETFRLASQYPLTLKSEQPKTPIYFESCIDFSGSLTDINALKAARSQVEVQIQSKLSSYFNDMNTDQFGLRWKPDTDELVCDQSTMPDQSVFLIDKNRDVKVDRVKLIVPHDGACASTAEFKTDDGVAFTATQEIVYQLNNGNKKVIDKAVDAQLDALGTLIASVSYSSIQASYDPESPFKLALAAHQTAVMFKRWHITSTPSEISELFIKALPALAHAEIPSLSLIHERLVLGLCAPALDNICNKYALSQVASLINEHECSIGRPAINHFKKELDTVGAVVLGAYIIFGILGLFLAGNTIQTQGGMMVATCLAAAACGLPYGCVMFIVGNCAIP